VVCAAGLAVLPAARAARRWPAETTNVMT
jgi:hypothetical protein